MREPVPFSPICFFGAGHGLDSRRERRQERLQDFLIRLLTRRDSRQKAAQCFELLLHQRDLNPTRSAGYRCCQCAQATYGINDTRDGEGLREFDERLHLAVDDPLLIRGDHLRCFRRGG